jgi:hypothetical protein
MVFLPVLRLRMAERLRLMAVLRLRAGRPRLMAAALNFNIKRDLKRVSFVLKNRENKKNMLK